MESSVMDLMLRILFGITLAIILHELTHLIVIYYYKIPVKAVVLTKWTAFGFLIENENYMNDGKKLILLHFLPLIWCLMIIIDPNEIFFYMFPFVNIFGGLGDFYFYFKIKELSSKERIEWANNCDDKILKSAIWKKVI
jgi:hypothetical protein